MMILRPVYAHRQRRIQSSMALGMIVSFDWRTGNYLDLNYSKAIDIRLSL